MIHLCFCVGNLVFSYCILISPNNRTEEFHTELSEIELNGRTLTHNNRFSLVKMDFMQYFSFGFQWEGCSLTFMEKLNLK